MSVLLADRLVPVFPAPVAYGRQCTSVTFLCRHLPHHVLALARLSPYVAEAKKGERGTIRARVAGRIWSIAAEVDEACLVGMEHEPEPRKTLAQDRQDALGVDNVVERHDRIISEPDKGTVPRKARPHLCLEPLIKHIVQEDVGEAWRDHTALGSAHGQQEQNPGGRLVALGGLTTAADQLG